MNNIKEIGKKVYDSLKDEQEHQFAVIMKNFDEAHEREKTILVYEIKREFDKSLVTVLHRTGLSIEDIKDITGFTEKRIEILLTIMD